MTTMRPVVKGSSPRRSFAGNGVEARWKNMPRPPPALFLSFSLLARCTELYDRQLVLVAAGAGHKGYLLWVLLRPHDRMELPERRQACAGGDQDGTSPNVVRSGILALDVDAPFESKLVEG